MLLFLKDLSSFIETKILIFTKINQYEQLGENDWQFFREIVFGASVFFENFHSACLILNKNQFCFNSPVELAEVLPILKTDRLELII